MLFLTSNTLICDSTRFFARRRINIVEEKMQIEQVKAVSPLRESLDKIKKVLGDSVKKMANLEALGGTQTEVDPVQIEELMKTKLEKFRGEMQESLDKLRTEQAEEASLGMETFRNEVEALR